MLYYFFSRFYYLQRQLLCSFSFLIVFAFPLLLNAQSKGNTWCFGDSVNISFQSGSIINNLSCNLNTIESSASISDDSGNLLFYCGGYTNATVGYLKILNVNNQVILNGDSILGDGTVTNGLLILPLPGDINKYYLFSRIATPGYGNNLYYSIIDMSMNGGNGIVIQKNILLSNNIFSEKLSAVKHANGRDWWIVSHQFSFTSDIDTFCIFLLSPSGVSVASKQSIGTVYSHQPPFDGYSGESQFAEDGSKFLCVGSNIIDLFEFDRCLGLLSNYQNLAVSNPSPPLNQYYGCSFSNDGTKIYISNWHGGMSTNLSYELFQMDLLAPNILLSKSIIFNTNNQTHVLGQHQLGPDGKIYIASSDGFSFPNNNYSSTNMNISVINEPDSTGLACSFNPFSVSLNGRRCYLGLPNIPNYNLGPIEGSICDTIQSLQEHITESVRFKLFPNPVNNYLSITYEALTDFKNIFLIIFDIKGKEIFRTNIYKPNGKINYDVSSLTPGIYLANLQSSSKILQSVKLTVVR